MRKATKKSCGLVCGGLEDRGWVRVPHDGGRALGYVGDAGEVCEEGTANR